ncbi:glycosyltransferase family 1 protein [Peribacillus saganii]|uniref:Glycosyltransferase family 1 protein n=1 Tax=Peribacillus saganii TaxID=2303992 RepID=A0A372LKG9_9BACI|nr:glycosyltransferase family 4 protein [Peribacillus saganii]RFU67125.1 glycosyltransferase family 1 protein [Peribacillus saganii]
MKILYVTTISGTINAFLVPHIKMLLKQGHSVDIACNIISPIKEQLLEPGCRIFNIEFQRSPLSKKNYLAYKSIKKLIQEEKYDLIHTHTPVASFLTRLSCRNMSNIKVLYTAHGFHFYKGAPLKNLLIYYNIEKNLAKHTDAIITINQEDYISAKKFKLKKVNSVYKSHGIGIDLNKFSPSNINEKLNLRKEYGYKSDDFILFFAAELNHNKHQDLLINAVSILKDKIPNINLLLAGEGPLMNQYEELVEMLELKNNISFLGRRNDVHNLLKLSDIGVASSRREGLPVNVMEAMATGLPLVVTDCRGNRDLVRDGENGYVVEIEDEEGFARAVKSLYDSWNLREDFSKRSLEFIKQFALENVLEEIKSIYTLTCPNFCKVESENDNK